MESVVYTLEELTPSFAGGVWLILDVLFGVEWRPVIVVVVVVGRVLVKNLPKSSKHSIKLKNVNFYIDKFDFQTKN